MLALFLDIETTGLDPRVHCPVEIAFKGVDLNSQKSIFTYNDAIAIDEDKWKLACPDSLKINGYTWEKVKKGKPLAVVQKEMVTLFRSHNVKRGKAVFICQNPAFDRTFMTHIVPIAVQEEEEWPYHWLDLASMYWALTVKSSKALPETMNLSKNAIAKQFGLPPEEYPHRAINGVDHLIDCYNAVMSYSEAK